MIRSEAEGEVGLLKGSLEGGLSKGLSKGGLSKGLLEGGLLLVVRDNRVDRSSAGFFAVLAFEFVFLAAAFVGFALSKSFG